MAAMVTEAVEAGALGVTTSRTVLHRGVDGVAVPGTFAGEDELFGLGRALVKAGRGVFELAPAGIQGEDMSAPDRELVEVDLGDESPGVPEHLHQYWILCQHQGTGSHMGTATLGAVSIPVLGFGSILIPLLRVVAGPMSTLSQAGLASLTVCHIA